MSQEVAAQNRTFYDIADTLAAYHETLAMMDAEATTPPNPSERLAADREEVLIAIEALGVQLLQKAENIVGVITRQKAELALLKEEEERIHGRRLAVEKANAWLKEYVIRAMGQMGTTLMRTPKATLRIQGNGGIEPLEITGPVDPEYLDIDVRMRLDHYQGIRDHLADIDVDILREGIPEPNQQRIREALAAGEEVENARLVARGVHLRTA